MNHFVDLLNRAGEIWWPYVLHATWQTSLVGLLLLAIVRLGRRWPSPLRYWLLVLALAKFAFPPMFAAPTGVFSRIEIAPSDSHAGPPSFDLAERPIAPEQPPALDTSPWRTETAPHAPGFADTA